MKVKYHLSRNMARRFYTWALTLSAMRMKWIENKELVQTASNKHFLLVDISSIFLFQNKGVGNSEFIFG